jgi:two-component system, response regulator
MKININRILVVEDNENDLELTLDALRKHNLANKIDIARDGADALDYVFYKGKWARRRKGNPAVILLDLNLPKIGGLEVLKRIKEEENTKTIPVVVLTSSCEEKDVIESYRFGTNSYVVKPVVFKDFMEAVYILGAFWGIINEAPVENSMD